MAAAAAKLAKVSPCQPAEGGMGHGRAGLTKVHAPAA